VGEAGGNGCVGTIEILRARGLWIVLLGRSVIIVNPVKSSMNLNAAEGGVGGSQTGEVGRFPRTKREVCSGTKID